MGAGRQGSKPAAPDGLDRSRYRLRRGTREIDVAGPIVIGREPDCQIVIDHGLASRRHARCYETDDGLVVQDLGSLNGVFVNQRRIEEPTLVAHGDVIGIGLESIEVVDTTIARRSQKPTLPAPVPMGESDVDAPEPVTVTTRLDLLTEREREVFRLIVLGHTQREIGEKLHLSVKTIESHRAHIAEKLQCRTRANLVAYAVTAGILTPRPDGSK